MKTKLSIALLALAGGIILFTNQIRAADSVTNSVGQTNEPSPFQIIVTPTKIRVHVMETFKVALEVKNVTNTNQVFAVANGSWPEHWSLDNSNVQINVSGFRWTRNYAMKVALAPGESYKKTLAIQILNSVSTNQISFRMGFTPWIPGKDLVAPSFEIKLGKTYWSDEVAINVNPKLIPDWISW